MFGKIKRRVRHWWNIDQFPIQSHDLVLAADDSHSRVSWSRRDVISATVVLFAISATILLPNLSYPLIDPDETRYAQIAMNMNESRDWVTPTLDSEAYLDKPPLMYWLTATSFSIFGNNQAAARLPSVLAALATIMMVFGLGRRLVGDRAALMGAISLTLCGGFVLAGRFLILDSLLAFFVVGSLLAGYIAVREDDHRWTWWMVSGVLCALGVLTKGPVALVLCAPPLVVSGWLRADQTRTRLVHWAAFTIPMILGCVPWYLAVWKLNPEFGDYFFLKHNLERFTQGSNHEQAFWFYLPVLFAGLFPTSLLLPSLGVFLLSRSNRKRRLRSKDLGFLFCSSMWILLFFSMASCKLPTYILPAIPLLCLMMGSMLDHTIFAPGAPNRIAQYLKPFPQRASAILVLAFVVVASADVWLRGYVGWTTAIAIIACLFVIAIIGTTWNREIAFSQTGWAFTVAVAIGVLGFTAGRFIPTASTFRSIHAGAALMLDEHPDAMVVFFCEKSHAFKLHLPKQKVVFFPEDMKDEFVSFISHHRRMIVVTRDTSIAETREALSKTHELVGTRVNKRLYWATPVQSVASARLVGREHR